jgi:hypothetical protein
MASIKKRLAAAVAAAGLSLGLGGCMGNYGYGGVGYASDYYDGYGYGYGPSLAYGGYGGYGGWYDDYYYPGTGIYVFDRTGRRSRWNNGQRRYWEGRREQWRGRDGQWQGRRGDWNGPRGSGRPSVGRPDRGPGDGRGDYGRPGYDRGDYGQRGSGRSNGLNRPVTQAQENALPACRAVAAPRAEWAAARGADVAVAAAGARTDCRRGLKRSRRQGARAIALALPHHGILALAQWRGTCPPRRPTAQVRHDLRPR